MNEQPKRSSRSGTWADRTSTSVGERVAHFRARAGLSARDLSVRLTEIGHPISRASISLLETGQRGVTFPDLLALSAALDVYPALLAFGLGPGEEALPGRTDLDGLQAIEWFSARHPLPDAGEDRLMWLKKFIESRAFSDEELALSRLRALAQAEEHLAGLVSRYQRALTETDSSTDPHQLRKFGPMMLKSAQAGVDDLRAQLSRQGIDPPPPAVHLPELVLAAIRDAPDA